MLECCQYNLDRKEFASAWTGRLRLVWGHVNVLVGDGGVLQEVPRKMELTVMKTLRSLIARVSADNTRRSVCSRPRVRRDPLCETLEGRRLLSTAASSVASGMPERGGMWAARHAAGGGSAAAEIAHFGNQGGHGVHGSGLAELAHSHAAGSFTPKG
jgi:hypothetical protein